MSTWTLNGSSQTKTLADWFIAEPFLRFISAASDQLSFSMPGDFDRTVFSYGSDLSLYKDGSRVFTGRITSLPRFAAADNETIRITASGPWERLERIVFEQAWAGETGTFNKSRVQLNLAADGSRISVGSQVAEILTYANTQGAGITWSSSDLAALDLVPPSSEELDLSCAEALLRQLAWHRDAVTYFEYSNSTPRLRIIKAASASARSFAIGSDELAAFDVTPRSDLAVRGVVINFEQTNTVDGIPYNTLVTQSAGATSGLDIIRQTVRLEGSNLTRQSQRIETENLSTSAHYKTRVFERANPWLADLSWEMSSPTTPPEAMLNPRILVSGSVQDWMNETAARGTFHCTATYTDPDDSTEKEVEISATVTLTSAETKTYRKTTSFTPAETVPPNLASKLYAILAADQYEGSLTLGEEEADLTLHPALVINLTGGLSEWTAMRAQCQEVAHTLETGETALRFGPPAHLGIQDFVELFRAARRQHPVYNPAERQSGTQSDTETSSSGLAPDTTGGTKPAAGLPADPSSPSGKTYILAKVFDTSSPPDGTLTWIEAVECFE